MNLTKSIFSVILFLVLLIIIPVQLFGQVLSESISVKGHWNPNNGGIPSKVIVQNNIAYIGAGKFLLIFDISDTSSPQYLSSVYLTNDVNGLDVGGNYVYVTAWWAGLSIIDVSDLNNPQIISNHLSTYFTGDLRAVRGVELADTRAYLFGYELEIVDISDPHNPVKIGSYHPGGNVSSVMGATEYGNYIYVSNHSGLRIIDFADAANPQVIGEFFIDSLWNNIAIVADDRAYLSLFKRYGGLGGGLSILDISTPQSPIELSRINTSAWPFLPTSISLFNTILFLGEKENNEPSGGKLKSYNVTNLSDPFEMDQINLPSGVNDISSRDGICYSADSDSAIMLVDITDANNLSVINSINTNSELKNVIKSDIGNNLAAVALGYKGIEIVDISNLAEPYSLSSMKFDGYTSSLKISNNYLYLNDSGILRIIDISNPQQPNEISSLPTGYINDMELNDGYLLICSGGMKVVDISNPITPQIVGEYFSNGDISSISVEADYAYLLSYHYFTYGIHIVDISEPTAPYLVRTIPLGTNEYSQLEINNSRLYVCGSTTHIYDISDPTNPTNLTNLDYWSKDIKIDDDYIYLASEGGNTEQGVEVLEKNNYQNVGYFNLPGIENISSIEINNHYIFAAWGDNGFYILRNDLISNVEDETNHPNKYYLSQNYPNPFNPSTKIKYTIPSVTLRQAQSDVLVKLIVYDVLGNEIATLVNEEKPAGDYEVEFSATGGGTGLSSGIYFYRFLAGSFIETKKMILLK